MAVAMAKSTAKAANPAVAVADAEPKQRSSGQLWSGWDISGPNTPNWECLFGQLEAVCSGGVSIPVHLHPADPLCR